MITELLMDFFHALTTFVLGLLPTAGPPDWWSNVSGVLSQVWAYGASLGAWFPWEVVGYCIPAVLVALGVGFGIKVVRIVLSFFTFGGGSAA